MMPPHDGLVHPKEYDIKGSNVELIGSDLDHRVKYKSAETEPAWNDGKVGKAAGLYVWRIEDFQVVVFAQEKIGKFYDGDSYIVLHSYNLGKKDGKELLGHDIFFWLGSKTSQDEAGTAAYKTVELDEFLGGVATQHREVQQHPTDDFVALFPHLSILSGGAPSGFRHVDMEAKPKEALTLLRIFKHPTEHPTGHVGSIIVHEVEPTWSSLDESDVFVLDTGVKIWVWQGNKCSPMEKARAAQVVNDLTLAKHVDIEVLAQSEARSKLVVDLLGGKDTDQVGFQAPRPISSSKGSGGKDLILRPKRLYRLSDASGNLSFDLVKDGEPIQKGDFDSKDVFLLDNGRAIWVWRGLGASERERTMWIKMAQLYIRQLEAGLESTGSHLIPFATVLEGHETGAFFKALEV